MNLPTMRALAVRGLLAVTVTAAVVAGVPATGPAHAVTTVPAVGLARMADDVPEWATTEEDKVKAFSVLAVGDPEPALLLMSDRDFVSELWKRSKAITEVHAAAELVLMENDEAEYVAFIRGGIHAAQARQIANDLVAEAELRAARSLRRNAAAEAGLVADEAMLLLSEKNFVVEILLRAEGARVRAAAEAALKAGAAELHEFLATGVKAAAEQDLQDLLDKLAKDREEEAKRLKRLAAMRSAAAVLGMVATDGMLAMTDQNFVVAIWNAAVKGSEVDATAEVTVRSSDPAVWRAFIDTGIHEANQRDITIALDKKTAADRRLAEDIVARADKDGNRNLALAARTALAGTPSTVADFLRVGQHQVRPDLPDLLQLGHTGMCLSIVDGSTANGARVNQYPCVSPGKGQSWDLLPRGESVVEVRNRNSRLCLAIGSASKETSAPALQWTCNGGREQQWIIEPGKSGQPQLRNNNSGLCLAIGSAATAPGAQAIQWTCNGGKEQQLQTRSRGLVNLTAGRFNRDAFDDLVAVDVATGKLFLYPGTAGGATFGARVQIGLSGWTGMSELTAGRFNRDAFDDLVAVENTTGKLYLYPGTAAGGAFGTRVEVGRGGWNGMDKLVGGFLNRDGYDDLLAVETSTGKLYLYPGTTAGGDFGTRVEVGRSGWNGMDKLVIGTFNRDEHHDLVAVEIATGKQFLYPGTAAGGTWGTRVEIGQGGWNGMSELTAGRFNADDHDDVLTVQNSTGKLFRYPGTAAGGPLGARVEIGIGG